MKRVKKSFDPENVKFSNEINDVASLCTYTYLHIYIRGRILSSKVISATSLSLRFVLSRRLSSLLLKIL